MGESQDRRCQENGYGISASSAHRVKLPENIALLLTQRRRTRYPKKRRVLDVDGKPIESSNVVNLRAQLRNAGVPLGEYVKTKSSFGINTAPTEAFVVDKVTRDKLIADTSLIRRYFEAFPARARSKALAC